ncbi:MAG: gliding motility-associated C-terminal domain-containing protein [Chitinophagaceae bacterium]
MRIRIVLLPVTFFFTSLFGQLHGQTYNWPLRSTPVLSFQWGAPQQNLVAKVKYAGDRHKVILQNRIYNYNCATFSTEGVSTDQYYVTPFSSFRMSLVRVVSAGLYTEISVPGSATSYGKDFETDSLENFFVLADNNGNTWDTAFHVPPLSNYTDSTQLLLFKMDTLNKVSWFKFYGGTSAEYAKCIKRTSDGNLLVLASTQSADGDVVGYQGGKDIWLLKINAATGAIIWQKTFGSAVDEVPSDMELLADGSIVISGYAQPGPFFPDSRLLTNAFLMKLDATGNVVWKKTFGGNGDDLFRNFIAVNDGGFACIGTTTSPDGDLPPAFGGSDVFITKHTSNGTLQWIKRYGNADNDVAGDIVYTSCDSSLFASYAKQYSFGPYPIPPFAQVTGVELGFRNNGTQFHAVENNYNFPLFDGRYNDGFTYSMAPNDRGGFLGANISHDKWAVGTPSAGCLYTRSFDVIEYGEKLTKNNSDTTICSGAIVWGQVFTQDTVFADTLRNGCGIDTLINKYTVHVISVADSLVVKDSLVCFGQLYEGQPVYQSFDDKDTSFVSTICGNKRVIKTTHVHVSDLFINAPGVVEFTPGTPVLLTPATNGVITWQANPTLSCTVCQSATATPLQPVLYYLTARKDGCVVYDTISMVKKGFYIYIPSGFTPNDDGLNDDFNAIASGLLEYEMRVYNRWGQLVFVTKSLTNGWDGTIGGKKQGSGVFVYMINIKKENGEKLLYKGTFALIR